MDYPKIETLFNRDEKFKVKEDEIRLPEFCNVKQWWITEKIDGMNISVTYRMTYKTIATIGLDMINEPSGREIVFGGHTEKAQIPKFLLDYLREIFTQQKLDNAFPELELSSDITLYGEGYGAKIQSGGNYRPKTVSFRLFDVWITDSKNPLGGWWLEPESVKDVAEKMGLKPVPEIGIMTLEETVKFVKSKPKSIVAGEEGGNHDYLMEGIVARTKPLMFNRKGQRVIWKLKHKDFA